MRDVIGILLLFIYFAWLIPAQAQLMPETRQLQCGVWGRVIPPGGATAEGMEIEITGKSPVPRQRMHLVNGAFDFRPLPPGIYQFRVFDPSGQVISKRSLSLKGSNDRVIVRIPYSRTESSSAAITSLAELSHKIPRLAQNAYRAGQKAAEAGELQKSIEYFQKAAELDPQLTEAELCLAVQHARSGRPDDALRHAERAFEISPRFPEAGITLALVLISAKQYVQAEALARDVLAGQPALPEMHAIVAVSLIGQKRNFEEALAHLGRAAEEDPTARLLAATTLAEVGQPTLAAIQVRTYLQSSVSECERVALERWLADLSRSEHIVAAVH